MSPVGNQQTPWEANFINQMKRLRDERGWTQSAMAEKVATMYGLKFHQPTIARIETGERPVRLDEAMAIAFILRTPFKEMIADDTDARIDERIRALTDRRSAIGSAAARLLSERQRLQDLLDSVSLSPAQVVRVEAALREYAIENAIADAVRLTVSVNSMTTMTFDSKEEARQLLHQVAAAAGADVVLHDDEGNDGEH